AGNAELLQAPGVVGEALCVGPEQRRGDQALAAEQLDVVAVGQAQDLLAVTVGLYDLCAFAKVSVAVRRKGLHGASRSSGGAILAGPTDNAAPSRNGPRSAPLRCGQRATIRAFFEPGSCHERYRKEGC